MADTSPSLSPRGGSPSGATSPKRPVSSGRGARSNLSNIRHTPPPSPSDPQRPPLASSGSHPHMDTRRPSSLAPGDSAVAAAAAAAAHGGEHEDIPQDQWLARVFRLHPEALRLHECGRSLSNQDSFSKMYGKRAKTEVKDVLTHDRLTKMLALYLRDVGLEKSAAMLQHECGVSVTAHDGDPACNPGLLTQMLHVGVKDLRQLRTKPKASDPLDLAGQLDEVVEVFEFRSGAETDLDSDDVGIWQESAHGCLYVDGLPGMSMPRSVSRSGSRSDIFESSPDGPSTGSGSPPLSPSSSIHQEPIVQGGSLNKLVEWLTSSADLIFRKVFLCTYPTICTSERLLAKLIDRHQVDKAPESSLSDREKQSVKARVVLTLKIWIDEHPEDFTEVLVQKLVDFIEGRLMADGDGALAKALRSALAKRIQSDRAVVPIEVRPVDSTQAPQPIVPRNIFSGVMTLADVDPEEIVRQMCLVDHDLYSQVRAHELIRANRARHHHGIPAISKMQKRFNALARWVANSILKNDSVVERAQELERFIKIANWLVVHKNFQSCMAVCSGLFCEPVRRLRFTLVRLSPEMTQKLNEMEELFRHEDAYRGYRVAYDRSKSPCIPWMGLHLQDLALIDEGVNETLNRPPGHDPSLPRLINFRKCTTLYHLTKYVLMHQEDNYHFYYVEQIASDVKRLAKDHSTTDDAMLFKRSLKCEPRGAENVQ